MQQYEMRLSGHVEELTYFLHHVENSAAENHKTLTEYVSKFLEQKDIDFHNQGKLLQDTIEREASLKLALQKLQNASPLEKPFVFLKDIQQDILIQTVSGFTFGLNLTFETLAYAGIGLLSWMILFSMGCYLFRPYSKLQ